MIKAVLIRAAFFCLMIDGHRPVTAALYGEMRVFIGKDQKVTKHDKKLSVLLLRAKSSINTILLSIIWQDKN